MRAAALVGCTVVGPTALTLGLQESAVPTEWRPYLIVVGAALCALAVILGYDAVRGRPGGPQARTKQDIKGNDNVQINMRDYINHAPPAPSAPPPEKEFVNAPHLLWSGVTALKLNRAYEVIVACDNVGAVATVRPDSWVRSTVKVLGPPIPGTDPIQAHVTEQEEEVGFFGFDVQGPIHPGRLYLRMQCRETDPIPGEREVRWRVVYMDDDYERGYITECAATVSFIGLGNPTVVGLPALDSTSRKIRNDDFNDYMKQKRGSSSTGPRRPHVEGEPSPVVVTPDTAVLVIRRTPLQMIKFAFNALPSVRRFRRYWKRLKHGL